VTQYILSEDADRDLDDIWDYIAEDNIDAADQWVVPDRLPGSVLAGGRLPRHLSSYVPAH